MDPRTIRSRLEIRRATPQDASIVLECTSAAMWRWTRAIGQVPGLPTQAPPAGAAPPEVWLASVAGVSIGLIALAESGTRLWIDCVAVFPRYARLGVGRALVAHAEARAANRGCVSLQAQLHPQMTEAILWFAGCGFSRVSGIRPRHPDVLPAVVLRKRPTVPALA